MASHVLTGDSMAKPTMETVAASHLLDALRAVVVLQAVSIFLPWWRVQQGAGRTTGHLFAEGNWQGQSLVDPLTPIVFGVTAFVALMAASYALVRVWSDRNDPATTVWIVAAALALQMVTVSGTSAARIICDSSGCVVAETGMGWTAAAVSIMFLTGAVVLLNVQRRSALSAKVEQAEDSSTPAD